MLIKELSAELRAALTAPQKEVLSYVTQIASLSNASIDDLPLVRIQSWSPESKGQINFELNSWFDAEKERKELSQRTETEKAIRYAKDMADRITSDAVHRKQLDLTRIQSEMANDQLQHRYKMQAAYKLQIEIEHQIDRPSVNEDLKKELTSFFTNPRWGQHQRDANVITCFSQFPTILTQRNKKSGINLEVNLGYFKLMVNLSNGEIYVLAYKGNLFSGEFYHPYLNRDGQICWGNAAGQADKLIVDRKWGQVLELLNGLLNTYDPTTTPYRDLFSFDSAQKAALGQTTSSRELPCDNCAEYDCESHHCEACDITYADGESCEGYFCEECGECVGRAPCTEHYCHTCGDSTLEGGHCTEGCCEDCGRTSYRCLCEPEIPEPTTEPTPEPVTSNVTTTNVTVTHGYGEF